MHAINRQITLYTLTAAVLAVAVAFPCQAKTPRDRFAVQVQILAANASQLLSPNLPTRYRAGLRARMAGALGTLRFLAREDLQARPAARAAALQRITMLRARFALQDWTGVARQAQALAQAHPLALAGMRPGDAGPAAIASGRHIYRHLCLGCHAHPDPTAAVPAPDLVQLVRTRPAQEYLARLIGGVHGDPGVALRNPFSDREIAGLVAYLRQGAHHHATVGPRDP